MLSWLEQAIGVKIIESPGLVAFQLALAFAFGYLIAGIYRLIRHNEAITPTFPPTLILLAILCAMLPHVIGDNVARAFGLVGALSIVRFRTVVDDTQDIAFVIFAVLIGMAIGANHSVVALIGTVIVGMAAWLIQPRKSVSCWVDTNSSLVVRVGIGRKPAELLKGVLSKFLVRFELFSTTTCRQGSAVDLTYKVRFRPGIEPTDLVDELNQTEGIQNIELRRG